MASKSLGTLTIDMVAKTGAFTAGMDKAERATSKFGKSTKSSISDTLTSVTANLKMATTALAGYTTALGVLALKATSAIASQNKLAEALHTSYDSITILNLAFADKGINNFESSLNRLNRRLGAAELGRGAALNTVKELNLNLKELAKVEADERLAMISDRIKEVATSSEMAARFAQELGFEQREAVNFFMQGGDAIRGYQKDVEKLGLALSDVDAKRIEEADKAMGFFGDVTKGATQQLAVAFAPAISATVDLLSEMMGKTDGLGKYFKDFGQVAITALGYVADGADVAYRAISGLMDTLLWITGNATKTLAPIGEAIGKLTRNKDLENFFKNQLITAEAMVEVSAKNMSEAFERNLLGSDFRKKYQDAMKKTFSDIKMPQLGGAGVIAELGKSYEELLGVYNKVQALQNIFVEELKEIESSSATASQKVELVALATQKYNEELEKLSDKKGYLDILGDLDQGQALANKFANTLQEIEKSTASYAEKLELVAKATEQYDEALNRLEPKKKTFDELLGNYDKNQVALNEYNKAIEEINNSMTAAEEKTYLQSLALNRLNESLEVSKGYWEQWLEGAQNALTSFDELGKTVVDNFTTGFGNAFEKIITGTTSLKDGFREMMHGMATSVINAIGQMIAQWIAYQAVQLMVGKTTQASAAAQTAGNAQAGAQLAGINAYASAAAIPYVGWAIAPAAMASALAVTEPMAVAASGFAMAGMAHDGIDAVPKTGTWLLEKGERVMTAQTSAKLDATLDRVTNNRNSSNTNNFYLSGEVDQRTQAQIANEISRRQRLADMRLGR